MGALLCSKSYSGTAFCGRTTLLRFLLLTFARIQKMNIKIIIGWVRIFFALLKKFNLQGIAGGIQKLWLFKGGVGEMGKNGKKKFQVLYFRSNERKFCSKVLQMTAEKRDVHVY